MELHGTHSVKHFFGIIALLVVMAMGTMALGTQSAWAANTDSTEPLAASLLPSDDASELSDEGIEAKTSASITYRAKLVGKNWQKWKTSAKFAGSLKNSEKLADVALKLTNCENGSVQYQVHVAGVGWNDVRMDGKSASSPSSDRAIDAIRVSLTGKISKSYSVAYRVKTEDTGWQNWTSDGAIAGKRNAANAIRAIEVKLVKKNAKSKPNTGIIGVRYHAKAQKYGWGEYVANNAKAIPVSKRVALTALGVKLDSGVLRGGVKYRVCDLTGRWGTWRYNGKSAKANAGIEAVQIMLTGSVAKRYDVVYRVYTKDGGWQRRMRNGETAGTEGMNWPVESIKIDLVPKREASGWICNNGVWNYYQSGKPLKNDWVVTDEHPIDLTTRGLQRYWIDANGALATNRYINPNTALDSNSIWLAYALGPGYVARGKFTNEDGLLLANLADGAIATKTKWFTTSDFDGAEQRYRLVKKGVAAVVQTGLFTVNGKKYYGFEDGRGYVMRSDSKYIEGTWYRANEKGILKKAKHDAIERYVQWAINIANDNSHGYSQANRWGPDYDCSSLVCASLLAAGFPDSGASWTGNMKSCLRKIGFTWHRGTSGLKRGDIMLVHNSRRQHTEIYIGNGQLVGAHISENGTIYGRAGDQTGREISVGAYYNAPWEGYLRYSGKK